MKVMVLRLCWTWGSLNVSFVGGWSSVGDAAVAVGDVAFVVEDDGVVGAFEDPELDPGLCIGPLDDIVLYLYYCCWF